MARFLQAFRDVMTVNGRHLGFNKEGQWNWVFVGDWPYDRSI